MQKKMYLFALAISALPFAASAFENAEQCREFTRDVFIGGERQQGYGTACLQPDGSWAISQENAEENEAFEMAEFSRSTSTYNRGQSPTRTYGARSYEYGVGIGTGGSSLSVGQGYYDDGDYPYYSERYDEDRYYGRGNYRWGRDRDRDNFYRYHRGPNWERHWEAHRRSMGR